MVVKSKKQKKTISLYADILEDLSALSRGINITEGEIVSSALREYFSRDERKEIIIQIKEIGGKTYE